MFNWFVNTSVKLLFRIVAIMVFLLFSAMLLTLVLSFMQVSPHFAGLVLGSIILYYVLDYNREMVSKSNR